MEGLSYFQMDVNQCHLTTCRSISDVFIHREFSVNSLKLVGGICPHLGFTTTTFTATLSKQTTISHFPKASTYIRSKRTLVYKDPNARKESSASGELKCKFTSSCYPSFVRMHLDSFCPFQSQHPVRLDSGLDSSWT
jgi:hypothetical protein